MSKDAVHYLVTLQDRIVQNSPLIPGRTLSSLELSQWQQIIMLEGLSDSRKTRGTELRRRGAEEQT